MDLLTFTEEEEKLIKTDRNKKISNQMTSGQKLLVIAFASLILAHAYLESMPPRSSNMFLFPNTWSCKCGYDNYDGINHCGICGIARGEK